MNISTCIVSPINAIIEQRIPDYRCEQSQVYNERTMRAVEMHVREI